MQAQSRIIKNWLEWPEPFVLDLEVSEAEEAFQPLSLPFLSSLE